MKISFQTRIVLFFSALFLGVQMITLFCVYKISYDNALKQLGQNLVYAEAVFNQLLTERGERMASEARILVADFGFRTTVSTGDSKTIASALENLTLRIRGKRAFYVALSGEIVADTAGRYQGTAFMFPAALVAAERHGKAVVFGRLDGELCEWAMVPVLAPIPIGWVVVAIGIDPRRTEHLRQLSALPIEVSMIEQAAGQTEVLTSTLSVNMQKLLVGGLSTAGATPVGALDIMALDGVKLITQQQQLPSAMPERPIMAVLQIDFAEALAPYWVMLYVALALLAFGLVVILFGSILIARKIAQPLQALAGASERMMDGQFDLPLPVTSQDELGRMAKTFNRAAQLATQMHELKQKDQTRREMVATVSHDLRNPLTALHAFLETMQLKAGSLPAQEQQRFLEVALRQSEKVNRLAQELFELAKLECDESCLNVEPFCMAELMQDVAQKFQLGAQQKGVRLAVPVQQGLPTITADIGLIERLLSNLLDNAIRNTPSGGEVRLNAWAINNSIKVSVQDTGIGIPADYLPTLFDWESPLSHRARADAGGFGLVIVAKIISLHEGHITVASTLGQGSEFCFELPLVAPVELKA
jgi:signal transduction histidine kinase